MILDKSSEVIIDNIVPIEDGALKVVIIIPKENFEAQKIALEIFFESSNKYLNTKVKGIKRQELK